MPPAKNFLRDCAEIDFRLPFIGHRAPEEGLLRKKTSSSLLINYRLLRLWRYFLRMFHNDSQRGTIKDKQVFKPYLLLQIHNCLPKLEAFSALGELLLLRLNAINVWGFLEQIIVIDELFLQFPPISIVCASQGKRWLSNFKRTLSKGKHLVNLCRLKFVMQMRYFLIFWGK